jgi:hypothetical protein
MKQAHYAWSQRPRKHDPNLECQLNKPASHAKTLDAARRATANNHRDRFDLRLQEVSAPDIITGGVVN